jgi:hypothetical protein
MTLRNGSQSGSPPVATIFFRPVDGLHSPVEMVPLLDHNLALLAKRSG